MEKNIETTTEQGNGIMGWVRENWTYLAAAVAAAGLGYSAYRYFGAEEVAEAADELRAAIGE